MFVVKFTKGQLGWMRTAKEKRLRRASDYA